MMQAARNLTDETDGFLRGKRYLIHDPAADECPRVDRLSVDSDSAVCSNIISAPHEYFYQQARQNLSSVMPTAQPNESFSKAADLSRIHLHHRALGVMDVIMRNHRQM